jgi:hypothetical protein
VLASAVTGNKSATESKPKVPGYHPSNLMIGTPDEVIGRIEAARKACSFSEITIGPQFNEMSYDEARESTILEPRSAAGPVANHSAGLCSTDARPSYGSSLSIV